MLRIFLAIVLVLSVTNANAQAVFSKEQTKEIQGIIESYIQENPEIVLKALEALQKKNIEAREAAVKTAIKDNKAKLFHNKNDMFIGNKDGKIAIVEFFDYNCGYCKAMFDILYKKVESNKDVKWILKELPTLSQNSLDVSIVAMAVAKQGKYQEFHKNMMKRKGSADKAAALEVAKELGVDMKKLEKDMQSKEIKDQLEANQALAMSMEAGAVPAFVIGEDLILGAFSEKELDEYIAKNYPDKK